jgi:hypothetical protein
MSEPIPIPPGEKLRRALRDQSFASAILPLVSAIREGMADRLDPADDWKVGQDDYDRDASGSLSLQRENLESADSLIRKLAKMEEKAAETIEQLDPEGDWGVETK